MNHGLSGGVEAVKVFQNHLRSELAGIVAEKILNEEYPGILEQLPASPAEAYLLGISHRMPEEPISPATVE